MEYKVLDRKAYKIHTIKTNRFKTTRIEMFFRMPVIKEKLPVYSFLSGMLNEGSLKYPKRKDIAIQLEELYRANYNVTCNKVGNCLNNIFEISFINPEYIDEKKYLDNIIEFFFEMVLHPNVKNNEFNTDNFNLVKQNILLDIKAMEENPHKKALNEAIIKMDKDSPSSYQILGTNDDIERITPESLYQDYLYMINNAEVDIFVIGNTNMENIVELIKKNYVNNRIRNNKIAYYVDNKPVRKVMNNTVESTFQQTQLVSLYNIKNLTKDEKEVTFHLFNYILGSGGLTSKLYRYIREEKSYCYQIASMYFKYDNLLCIGSSLAYQNVNDSLKLIRKAVKEMKDGIFTEEDIEDAKKNLLLSLNINRNNPASILANYEFKVFLNNYDIDEKIDLLKKITKKDIVNLAQKIKENSNYILKEEPNETDKD